MSKLIAQHGPAKGQKITEGLEKDGLGGVIFSPNDENIESISSFCKSNPLLNRKNTFLDPQFYFSTYQPDIIKKLADIECFPFQISRRDWRNKDKKIIDYLDYHHNATNEISDMLITPGFRITNIDWHFDYSVEIFNYCVEKYEFENYALSLLIDCSFFNAQKNVDEMLEELNDTCGRVNFIYLIICYDGDYMSNYDEIDGTSLSNLLSFIYRLRESGFKLIIGYSFMNSILFSMLDCEFIASGWFNTLRKFKKNRFELIDTYGRRKKRYTSIPLLSYLPFDNIEMMTKQGKLIKEDILSGSRFDSQFMSGGDSLSFVDLEHQYWESLASMFEVLSACSSINDRIRTVAVQIEKSINIYNSVIEKLIQTNNNEAVRIVKTISRHLSSWQLAIELFRDKELLYEF